jgi:hypothetical protein
VNKSMLALLTDAERLLVAETEKPRLATMDEDELAALHDRIRRARNKYSTNYRRQAASSVSTVGGRGKAHGQNQRSRDKAEVFELALANVSTALAAAARRSAADLKDRHARCRARRPGTEGADAHDVGLAAACAVEGEEERAHPGSRRASSGQARQSLSPGRRRRGPRRGPVPVRCGRRPTSPRARE